MLTRTLLPAVLTPTPVPLYALFVDMGGFLLGAGDFTGGSVPTGIGNWAGNNNGSLTVTGTVGTNTLTVGAVNRGALADYGGTWACVVVHDDGSYGVYTATNVNTGSSSLDVYPRLTKAVTSKQLGNLHDSFNGQHLTQLGYQALATYLFNRTKRDCYLGGFADRRVYNFGGTGFGTGYANVGVVNGGVITGTSISKGLTETSSNLNGVPSNSVAYTGADRSYHYGDSRHLQVASGVAGQGASQTVSLGGRSGYFTATVSVNSQFSGTEASSVTAVVTVDGVTAFTGTITGLQRIVVPFTSATTGVASFTLTSSAPTVFRVSRSGWYAWPKHLEPVMDEPLFPNGSRLVVLCDSWGTFYSSTLATTLNSLITAGGGTVTNVSVSGQTAAWALTTFEALVLPSNPTHVLFDFVINDVVSAIGAVGWFRNIKALTNLARRRGVVPVVLTSVGTASLSQAQEITKYACELLATYGPDL